MVNYFWILQRKSERKGDTAMPKSYDARLEKLEHDIARYKEKFATDVLNGGDPESEQVKKWLVKAEQAQARITNLKNRQGTEKRKARTKRLIEKGAVLETYMTNTTGVPYVLEAPRVAKKDNPEGYERYKAYRAYTEAKEELASTQTPADASDWLNSQKKAVYRLAYLEKLLSEVVRPYQGRDTIDWNSERYSEFSRYLKNLRGRINSNSDRV